MSSPTRFEIEIGPPEESAAALAVMELREYEWKLTEIIALRPLSPKAS